MHLKIALTCRYGTQRNSGQVKSLVRHRFAFLHLLSSDKQGEVRELTKEDFAHARPASEVLPEILGPETATEFLKPKPRGPQKKPSKTSTTIRLDVEVLEAFQAMGKGWQTRINKVLRDYVRTRKRSA